MNTGTSRDDMRLAQMAVDPPITNEQMLRMIAENAERLRAQAALEKTFRWRLKEWWETHRPHIVWDRYWEDL